VEQNNTPATSSQISDVLDDTTRIPSVSRPVSAILTPPETQLSSADNQPAEQIAEQAPSSQNDIPPIAPPVVPPLSPDAEKLRRYMEQDTIYQSMLRTVDAEKIRLKLALRYTLMMFAIFLVIAWIVSNRVIMFGFSEFQILARIRDALFGILAGLFSLTIWFGSDAWFRRPLTIAIFRFIAVCLFCFVLSALYLPLW
jgi:hypothetical protein